MVPPALSVAVEVSGLRCTDKVMQDLDEVEKKLSVLGEASSVNRPQALGTAARIGDSG